MNFIRERPVATDSGLDLSIVSNAFRIVSFVANRSVDIPLFIEMTRILELVRLIYVKIAPKLQNIRLHLAFRAL